MVKYKQLHIFELIAGNYIIIGDPCQIMNIDNHSAMVIDRTGTGLVSLIDDDRIMMLSLDTPDKLAVDDVHFLDLVPIDTGTICFVDETVRGEYSSKTNEEIFSEDDTNKIVIHHTMLGDGLYPVFCMFLEGDIVALCVWRGEIYSNSFKPDEDHIFSLFNN